MVQAETIVGPQSKADGSQLALRSSRTGAGVVTDAHGKYQEALLRGNVYSLSVVAGTPTAYTGAAGGTPLLAIHNPAGSQKALVVLAVILGITTTPVITTASAASTLRAYGGVSASPTGTVTAPTNMLTYAASGSIAKAFSNTPLTGSTALSIAIAGLATALSVSNATVEIGSTLTSSWVDVAGTLVAIPGNEIAVGLVTVPGSIAVDATIIWEEVPYP
jgi:membrane-associated protease RseP (regulator of RpoE activity)